MGTVAILRVLLVGKGKGAGHSWLVRDLRCPRCQDRSPGTLHPCFNFSRFYVPLPLPLNTPERSIYGERGGGRGGEGEECTIDL